ncbi:MAG: hypothetical protein KAU21_14590 [Gammaproteobacteria bacterium]|nr:hypothetical protein [Gammaproteobacteria bacterium]
MKTLLTIAAVITLSSNAYAVNPNDTAGAIGDYLQQKDVHGHEMPLSNKNFWAQSGALLDRFGNSTDSSYTLSASSDTVGSQPAVGSAMHEHMLPQNSSYWKENGALIERNHNPDS